jgi:ATP-dependent protease ClpP protease subunit
MSVSLPKTIKYLLLKQWRGEYSPLVTLLFLMLGLRITIGFIPFVANPFLSVLIVSISLLVYIWQVVGTWRCIERHLKASGEMMVYWAGWAAIVVAIVLTLLHTVDLLVGPPPKITMESIRTKPLPKLSEDGSRVYLKGEFNFDLNSDLQILLKQNATIKTIELDSSGGLIYAARALAFTIGKNQLNTHVEGVCNSACTVAFMAGNNRTLGENGKIGFHQYEFQKQHPLQVKQAEDEQEKDRQYFLGRGVSKEFLETVYRSGHHAIWQPERTGLKQSGVITQN